MISCHARDFERHITSARVPAYPSTRLNRVPGSGYPFKPGTGVPGALILGEYELLLVKVTARSEAQDRLFSLKRVSWRILYEIVHRGRDLGGNKLPCPGISNVI